MNRLTKKTTPNRARSLVILASCLAISNIVYSQTSPSIAYTFYGVNTDSSSRSSLGTSVSDAGDVNADGYDDVIVGSPNYQIEGDNWLIHAGRVQVFSGLDGLVIHTFYGRSGYSDSLGESVSGAGDVNGDGYDDLIVAPVNADSGGNLTGARVYSGLDGSVLYTVDGENYPDYSGSGLSVSGAGDVNADGYDDFIVGSPLESSNGSASGSARVYSGVDGSLIYTFTGETFAWAGPIYPQNVGDYFGYSVSGAGDVNGDGYADVIVGSPKDDNPAIPLVENSSGSALIFSGFDGSLLHDLNIFSADSGGFHFGWSVSGAGDVNKDGYDDVIVGSPVGLGNGQNSAGTAWVFSGVDGSVIYNFDRGDYYPGEDSGVSYDNFGISVSGAGDVNGDGYDDVIVGAPFDDPNGFESGKALVFSGIDGSLIYTFNGNEEQYEDTNGDYFGTSVSGAGDTNGDGYADLIVGAPGDDNAGDESGSAQVFLGGGQSGVAGFSGGILTIPVLQVANTFYRVELELLNSEPIEFGLGSLSVLTNPETENLATFANDVISIPLLLYEGVFYRLELSVYSMAPEVILRVAGVEEI